MIIDKCETCKEAYGMGKYEDIIYCNVFDNYKDSDDLQCPIGTKYINIKDNIIKNEKVIRGQDPGELVIYHSPFKMYKESKYQYVIYKDINLNSGISICEVSDFEVGKEIIDALLCYNDNGINVLNELDGVTPLEDFLEFIADRLEYVHGDNPHVDYIISLRKRAETSRKIRQYKKCEEWNYG